MSPDQSEPNDEAALRDYGDAVDLAVKVPTLTGVVVALVAASFVWAWQRLRRRRRTD
jgi:hypothetical protein